MQKSRASFTVFFAVGFLIHIRNVRRNMNRV